jgi:microcystin-dependent protein
LVIEGSVSVKGELQADRLRTSGALQVGDNTLYVLNNASYPPEPFLSDFILSDVLGADGPGTSRGRISFARYSVEDFSDVQIGIGLGDPQHKLHLHNGPLTDPLGGEFAFTPRPVQAAFTNDSTGKTASDGLLFGIEEDGTARIDQQEAQSVSIATDGVDRLTIDGLGRVGIGTPTPQAALHVAGVAGSDGVMFPDGTVQTTAASTGTGIPTGGIILWSGNVVPAGWALCDGGGGTPDLRDRFIVGAGASYALGDTGGEAFHTLTIAEMPSHTHGGTAAVHPGPNAADGVGASKAWNQPTAATGGGQPHENRPPYYALAYIMKL